MNVLCPAVHVALGTVGVDAITGPAAAHIERCENCSVEISEHRRIQAELASLEPAAHTAPSHLQTKVMSSLGPIAVPDLESRGGIVVPVAAAAFVATAAAGTAVLLRMRRQSAA